MNPYRLIALVIIALFALGYARLLIDTGVRDEEPEAEEMEYLARAACTAIGDPLGEALGIEWEKRVAEAPFAPGSNGCLLTAPLPGGHSADEVRVMIDRLFIAARWEARERPPGFDLAFDRRPVTCAARLSDSIVAIHCGLRG